MLNNNQQLDTMQRNEAIAELMGFKKYIPSSEVRSVHEREYPLTPIQWFFVPGIGRYNSFELKFDSDWNWLISCVIELNKYKYTHQQGTRLFDLFSLISGTNILDLNMKHLWIDISNYALEVRRIKNLENKPQPPLNNSDEWYKILYPGKNVVVMDPDGWDRKNWQFSWYEELITAEEFNERLMKSTYIRERTGI
jgi:hypothetical protein